ncbi:hypothetical protein Bca52824_014709 [Brassica carinata]|uniref:Uncharacterized protein n=1 Tax=Brassica carinata TaxID=52824 RepID=A0A8X7W186_BRACI|nr:hypothetical protein Bca52824_014709 [Brassica carinata]
MCGIVIVERAAHILKQTRSDLNPILVGISLREYGRRQGKELVDDTPPSVEQNDNKNETEIHKQPSSESEFNSYEFILYWPITVGKCDQEKYGGLLPKKIPLISKLKASLFFSSSSSSVYSPLVSLFVLISICFTQQPTPHQQPRARRMALSSGDNTEDAEADNNEPLDDQASASAADNTKDDGGIDAADAKDNIKS